MADPNPQDTGERTRQLHALHHATGRLIALEAASKAPRILIDGDIEIAWPESVKQKVKDRIVTKTEDIAAKVAELQNVKPVD